MTKESIYGYHSYINAVIVEFLVMRSQRYLKIKVGLYEKN